MGTNVARRGRTAAGTQKKKIGRPSRSGTRRPASKRRAHHHRELAGLGLVATGAFLGAVMHIGVNGGPVGRGLETFVRLCVGRATVLVPVLLVASGIAVIMRPRILRTAPFRTGAAVLAGALLLALAAGSLGFGGAAHLAWFDPAIVEVRGGMGGEILYALTGNTVGGIGTSIIVVLGLIVGLALISGASIAGVLGGSGRGAAVAGRTVGRGMTVATLGAVRGGQRLTREVKARWPVRAQAATPRPLLDGADHYPDIFDEPGSLPPSPSLGDGLDDETDADAGEELWASAPPASARRAPESPPIAPQPSLEDDEDALATLVGNGPQLGEIQEPGRLIPPRVSLLRRSNGPETLSPAIVAETSARLVETLGHFGIEASVGDAVSGPRVTRYELQLAPGTKVSRVVALRDDIAYALAARDDIRIIAPIPGKQAIGVEVPNPQSSLVTLGDIHRPFPREAGPLVAWLGLDLGGKAVYMDVARMPHLLIAGSTGTGKSVCLNALLAGILLQSSPDELKMILIDPKKVELNHYESIPHLLTPVVTNMRNAAAVLANVVKEMETRYERMGLDRARNIRDWNAAREARDEVPIPSILVVIDELADLMMVSPAEVEDAIIRLAQKSRAVGIHLVLATQRPSVDVITGMIKANVPSRIAFAVSSQVDSRVILDANGAESLLGGGDMLFRPVGTSRLQRLQGAYVSEDEIRAITDHWRAQGRPELREELLERPDADEDPLDADADDLLEKAIETVFAQGSASVSLLQRRLGVGYARAGRLVDMLERMGIVSGHEGSKPRTVLVTEADLPRLMRRGHAEDSEEVEQPVP